MANQKSNEKEGLYTLLRSHGFDPVMRDTTGGVVPVSDDAEVFQFNFDAEGDNAPVTVSIDEDNKLVIYYGDEVKQTGSEESWYSLLKELKRYAQGHQLSFQLKNKDHLRYDMAKRTHMKKVDESKTNEGLADDVADMARGMKNKDGSPRFANVRQGKPPVKPAGKATAPRAAEKGATSPADWYDQASGGRRYTGDSKVPTGTMVEGSGPKEKQKRPFQSLDQMRDTAKQKSEKNKQDKKASAAEKIGKKQVEEGYYATGRKSSYSDAVPQVKIILQHSRQLEEGERRYRAIERIFVENAAGERFLLDTTKPGLARVYARHIAEGGTPYDEQGKHIHSLCEEYTKMAGFVRATRNGQFNESTQSLVNEGVNHYNNLRETLHKMAGRRGYNAYFESWTPTLTEDEDSTDLSEMFASTELDPRIESVMPILRKLNKNITEVDHSAELAEWADDVIDESLGLAEVSKGLATKAYAKRSRDAFDQSDYATNADDHKSAEDASNKADKTYDRIGKRWGKDAKSSADKAANKEIFGNEKIAEVSNDLLGRYKKKAGEQATVADKAGNFEKGHKRFKGIVKATLKQFANDKPKQVAEGDGLEALNTEGIPEDSTHKGGTVVRKNGVTKHTSGPGIYGGFDADTGPDSPDVVHTDIRGAKVGHKPWDRDTGEYITKKKVKEELGPEQKAAGQAGPTDKAPLRGKLVGACESVQLDEYHAKGTVNGKKFVIATDDAYDARQIHSQNPHLSPDEAQAIQDHTETDEFVDGHQGHQSQHGAHHVQSTSGGYHGDFSDSKAATQYGLDEALAHIVKLSKG